MATFIHRLALCDSDAIGDGTRIWAFAHVMQGAVVGCDCNIGDHAFVESGATVGDRVTIKNGVLIWDGVTIADEAFIGPGVIFTNDRHPRSPRMPAAADRYAERSNWLLETHIGRGASLGAGSVILPGISIGDYAMVGAGAVVTRDVARHSIVVGHPARAIGWACQCGQHSPIAGPCESCRKAEGARGEGRGASAAGPCETCRAIKPAHSAAAQPAERTAPPVFVSRPSPLAPRP